MSDTSDGTTEAEADSTLYSVLANPGASFSAPSGAPVSTVSGPPRCQVEVGNGYTATAYPITINPGGAIQDSSGNWHILIGQQCAPTLTGLPPGLANRVTSYRWSVTGATDRPGDWAIGSGETSATFSGPNAAFTSTLPTPSWYWNDLAGTETITCKATVTPPAGQGAAFTMTVTQNVTLDAPTYSNDEVVGVVQINDAYPPINRDAQGNPQNLDVDCLWAGPGPNSMPPNGIQFRDAVSTPSLYSGTGTWYHLQLPTPSKFRAGIPSQYNGLTGLDGSFPYGSTFNADGTVALHPDDDGPGFPLENRFQEYKVQSETYQDYIMYTPPGANSAVVPLAYFTWNWNVDVTEPALGWVSAVGMPTGGMIASSGTASRETIYPTWSRKASSGW